MGSRKKLTQEDYIASCKEVHNNFYDYTNTKYVNGRTKVEIECPLHGTFVQKAESHKSGAGCQVCGEGKKSRGAKPTTSSESFLVNAKEAHGDKYTYEDVIYTRAVDKVWIKCKEHGLFHQAPISHTKGRGCPICANEARNNHSRLSVEESVAKCVEVHGDKYDYSAVEKVGDRLKMPIFCKQHQGFFHQTTGNHMQGQGCPICSKSGGFRVNKPGTLYVIFCDDVTKVGITNKTVKKRMRQISNSYGKEFQELFTTHSPNGQFIADLETACLKYLRSKYEAVADKFDGSTECFYNVSSADMIQFILPRSEVPLKLA